MKPSSIPYWDYANTLSVFFTPSLYVIAPLTRTVSKASSRYPYLGGTPSTLMSAVSTLPRSLDLIFFFFLKNSPSESSIIGRRDAGPRPHTTLFGWICYPVGSMSYLHVVSQQMFQPSWNVLLGLIRTTVKLWLQSHNEMPHLSWLACRVFREYPPLVGLYY